MLCHDGACRPCDVICTGNATASTTTLEGGTSVEGNQAGLYGGGIYAGVGQLTIRENCRVQENKLASESGSGGGIFNIEGTVTLDGPDPSPIVVDNCPENCAGFPPVPKCAAGPDC